jgi:hypothetical protein
MRTRLASGILVLSCLVSACDSEDDFDADDRAEVTAAVDSAVRAFEAAQRGRDAAAAVALLAPEFYMYTDGVRTGYDSVAASIRRSFPAVRYLDPGFQDVRVHPLSENSALSSFRFRDSLVTGDGVSQRFTGATTLLWERRDGRWLMTYGHADHRPVQ